MRRCFPSLPLSLERRIFRMRPRHHRACLVIIRRAAYFVMLRDLLDHMPMDERVPRTIPAKILYDVFRVGIHKTLGYTYRR